MTLNSYFTIPNQKEIFELSGSELKILTALRAVTYQNKEFLILSEKAKQEILKLLSKTYSAFKPIQRIISRLVTKGIIWLKKSGIYSKVLFQHSKSATSAPPYISKEEYSKEATSPIGLQKEQTKIHSFYIQSPTEERKNIISNIDHLSTVENEKGINTHSIQQPIVKNDLCNAESTIEINNQYIKALKQQMLKYGYTNQDIETAASLIFKAKNKGIKSDRIDALAKAIIYNRIDKSVKRKPINDLKAFIISSLFSKEERFIFHKLENLQNFPFEPIKTESDIRQEQEQKRAAELQQVQQLEVEKRSAEQAEFENMENALKDKLNEKYETEFTNTKQSIIKKTGNIFIPWPEIITSLYETIFNADNDCMFGKC
jgi:hypothetical protein